MNRTMRVIVINHVAADSIYGANQSVQRHVKALKDYSDTEIQVINRIPLSRLGTSQSIDRAHFPMSHEYEGAALSKKLLAVAYKLLTGHRHLITQVVSFQPDVIHLNSLTLLPTARVLKRNMNLHSIPIVMSAREMLRVYPKPSGQSHMSTVDLFVAIDPVTRNRMLEILPLESRQRVRICPNLFDINIASRTTSAPSAGRTFALIGRVEPEKGARFVTQAFQQAAAPGAQLMIIGGSAKDQYVARPPLESRSAGIINTGQIANLLNSPAFAQVDFIIRGEKSFHGLGRSGIEGLLSGKVLLLPSPNGMNPTSDQTLRELTDMGRICWYRANDKSSLSSAISRLATYDPSGDARPLPIDSTLWFQDPKKYAARWVTCYHDVVDASGRRN